MIKSKTNPDWSKSCVNPVLCKQQIKIIEYFFI